MYRQNNRQITTIADFIICLCSVRCAVYYVKNHRYYYCTWVRNTNEPS